MAKLPLKLALTLISVSAAPPSITIPLTRRNRSLNITVTDAGLKNDVNDYLDTGATSLFSAMTNDNAKQQPVFHFNLKNYMDYQYYGSLYVGS